MNTARILRICLLLALIFVAGVLTGRWTAPRPPILVPSVGGGVRTAEMALARMTAELGLDAEQQARFRPMLEEMAGQLAVLPPRSRERLEVLRQHSPRLRAVLRPEQAAAFDRMLENLTRVVAQRQAREHAPRRSVETP